MQCLVPVLIVCFAQWLAGFTFAAELNTPPLAQAQTLAKETPAKSPAPAEEKPKDKESSEDVSTNSKEQSTGETEKPEEGDKPEKEQDSDTPAAKSKKDEAKKPKPYEVEQDKLTIEVELSGVFVADEMEEVALRPEVWSQFKVLEAVEHGTTVKKGDVLVRFDDEKLEDELSDESIDQRVSELSLMQEEEELPRVKRLLELSYEAAKRKNEQTKADYEYYHSVDRPISVQIAKFRYKSAQEQFASAEEELDQLQKMYQADELTEETEKIVLRRQGFEVETAKLVLELQEESRDYTLNVALPRSDDFYKTELEVAELGYKQAKTALEIGTTLKNFELEKKRSSRAKSVERQGKLLSDKGLMVLRAPADGVVYYGDCINGKWPQISTLKSKLKPFGTVPPNAVLLTIVKAGSLHVESALSEKELPEVEKGMRATIVPTADKELELEGKVAQVGTIPEESNKFPITLEFENSSAPEWLVAGLTCKASVVVYENEEALTVPLALVQTDEDDEKIKYVMLVDPDEDEPVRREVKLGRKQGKVVEILKGLEEGDKIVKEVKKDKDEEDE